MVRRSLGIQEQNTKKNFQSNVTARRDVLWMCKVRTFKPSVTLTPSARWPKLPKEPKRRNYIICPETLKKTNKTSMI